MNRLAQDLEFVTEHTGGLWEEARGKRFFITGGTGFFGCWLLESFCWANHALGLNASVTVLTRNPEAFRRKAPHLVDDPAVTLLRGDVRNLEFPAGGFDFVIHAATDASGNQARSTELELLDTIVEGTRRTLEFARARGVSKFLLTSSGAVYGTQPPEIATVDESFTGAPDLASSNAVAVYGEGKRMAEMLCHVYSRSFGLECKIARCFAFVGPHLPLDAHFAIGNFIGNALRGEPMQIRGDGTPLRSYLYMADTMIWLWTILFRGQSCRVYNVGSEQAVSIRGLAERVAEVLSPESKIIVDHSPAPGAAPSRYVPSTRRAQDELGLIQRIELSEAIRRTAAWNQQENAARI